MKKIFFAVLAASFLFACNSEQTEDATENQNEVKSEETVPEDVVAVESEDDIIQAYIADKGWEAIKDPSGVYIVIDEVGAGEERPLVTDEVTMFYQGYFLNGEKFDGSDEAPLLYPLTGLIKGWQIGVPYFGKNGKGKLIIPSSLAYGAQDRGPIPGGSTLMFEVNLIDWNSL